VTSALFDKQATGGSIARNGFDYQDAYLLQHFPAFLAQGAFSHAVSEVLGDIEVRYYRPSGGTYCVLYEAKRNQLTKAELWAEVARFFEVFEKSPDEYVRFVLVCGDFNGEFKPLFNKLERLRGPGASLNNDSAIRSTAEADIVATVQGFGQSNTVARFVLERVSFVKYDDSQVDGNFAAALESSLPAVADMRGSEVAAFRSACRGLVGHSIRGVFSRAALEAALVSAAPTVSTVWQASATAINLGLSTASQIEELHLDVARFNGPDRGALGSQWQQLAEQAQLLGKFVHESRGRRKVRLSAKQRMSLACLLGFSFSATRDFTLEMLHNSAIFDTSVHERAPVPPFTKDEAPGTDVAGQGVVAITFPNAEWADIEAAAESRGLGGAARLHLHSPATVGTVQELNSLVHEAKTALSAFRSSHRLQRLHLFIKAPSVFAMALGHRLNGVGTVQLYDWVDYEYQATVQLV
jgi:hypothetical protein